MRNHGSRHELVRTQTYETVLDEMVFKQDTAVTMTFENGTLGTTDNSRKVVYGYDQRVEVFGSEGMIASATYGISCDEVNEGRSRSNNRENYLMGR